VLTSCGHLRQDEKLWLISTNSSSRNGDILQVRIADEERTYAAQAAQAALDLLDKLESHLSRFRANSDIVQIAHSRRAKDAPKRAGLCCLEICEEDGVGYVWVRFCHGRCYASRPSLPQWHLLPEEFAIQCDSGQLHFDLARSAGFALDRMAELLRNWIAPRFCSLQAAAAFCRAVREGHHPLVLRPGG